jgi:hypothetical protein
MSAALKSLSKYYNSYKVIDPKNFDPSNLYEDLVKNLIPSLGLITQELTDPSIPMTQFTVQMISNGLVSKEKFIEVNLNLKEVQKTMLDISGNQTVEEILFTSFVMQ